MSVMDKQVRRGIAEESKEHPWLKKKQVGQLVEDHLKKHPFMYKK